MNPGPEPLLTVSRLAKVFRGPFGSHRLTAVDDISFGVDRGQVLGLIGPNGSGKTTALRCALGFIKPTRGSIRLFGEPPLRPAARRGIGFAPERFEPSTVRTGRRTLELLGQLAGLDEATASQRASAVLGRFELTHAADRRVGGYSKGMRRRLAIAQALLHDPALVVLDEPFDGLDPLGVLLVRDEIAARARRGVGVIVSSHQLADVEAIATDLLVMNRGRAVASGTLSSVLDRRGVTRLEVAGLDDAALEWVASAIEGRGGRILECTPARESLEELFSRLVGSRPADDDREPRS